MFRSVLVANRGEIAVRVFATARRMGLATVAVHSEADADALHVRAADRAVLIGPAAAAVSYLAGEKIIAAARAAGAEAIHPGYGFLSENAAFAEAVIEAGLVWIGPPPAAIRAMGLKDAAKALMAKAGVPVTPGYLGEDQADARLAAEAAKIGFPVLIKAVAGGGGKGMRRVERADDFAVALAGARREAMGAFGDDRVLLETYVQRPRHIEVQVFGDTKGNIVHLYERDCSLQRRHQKVIEEAPAPGMDEATRAAVTVAAVKAAKAVDYVGAGTVEFIADASDGLRADRIWFMEMNTRLQVEHPVTEAITGLDLVEWQLRIAAGEPLPLIQDQIERHGHAVEARLYAEDPAGGRFLPSVGRIDYLHLPAGVRVDAGVAAGGEASPHYDPMLAKIITHAPDRQAAVARAAAACREVDVWPIATNAGFLARCLVEPDFIAAAIDTGFIDQKLAVLAERPGPSPAVLTAAARALLPATHEPANHGAAPWRALTGFRLNAAPDLAVRLFHDGAPVMAEASTRAPGRPVFRAADDHIVVFEDGEAYAFLDHPPHEADDDALCDGQVRAPMPGKVTAVLAAAGDTVARGQTLAVLEAMKMEYALVAPFDGVVAEIAVRAGDQTSEGRLVARIEASAAG